MTTDVQPLAPEPRPVPFLPREHGFWTMLAAVIIVAIVHGKPSPAVLLVALAVLASAVVMGGAFGRGIRRHGSLQLSAAAALSLAGIPVELVGGVSPASILLTTLTWAVVFTSSALCVRASFARASRKQQARAVWLQRAAEAMPCLAAVLFAAAGARAHTIAALLTWAACLALGVKRPSVKQMKGVGLSLAGVVALAAVALVTL